MCPVILDQNATSTLRNIWHIPFLALLFYILTSTVAIAVEDEVQEHRPFWAPIFVTHLANPRPLNSGSSATSLLSLRHDGPFVRRSATIRLMPGLTFRNLQDLLANQWLVSLTRGGGFQTRGWRWPSDSNDSIQTHPYEMVLKKTKLTVYLASCSRKCNQDDTLKQGFDGPILEFSTGNPAIAGVSISIAGKNGDGLLPEVHFNDYLLAINFAGIPALPDGSRRKYEINLSLSEKSNSPCYKWFTEPAIPLNTQLSVRENMKILNTPTRYATRGRSYIGHCVSEKKKVFAPDITIMGHPAYSSKQKTIQRLAGRYYAQKRRVCGSICRVFFHPHTPPPRSIRESLVLHRAKEVAIP